ncbi:MAG: hypothetical protein HN985_08155, partial [Planctomycetaceae bacterium]|nr:hypothetical protein [Planctomycetaceae bacterium]
MTTSTLLWKRLVLVVVLALSASASHGQDVQVPVDRVDLGVKGPATEDGGPDLKGTGASAAPSMAFQLPDDISNIFDRRWAD